MIRALSKVSLLFSACIFAIFAVSLMVEDQRAYAKCKFIQKLSTDECLLKIAGR